MECVARGERLDRFVSAGAIAGGVWVYFWRRFKLVENISHAGNSAQRFHERNSLALVFQVARERHASIHNNRPDSQAAATGALQPAID